MSLMPEWIVTSCVLILLTLAVRRLLLGRVDPRVCYALWGLVLLRLLLPFSLFPSRTSVLNMVESPAQSVAATLEETRVYSYAVDVDRTEHTLEEYRTIYADKGTLHEVHGYPSNGSAANTWTLLFTKPLSELLPQILLWIWIGGMAVTGGTLLYSNLSFWRRLRRSRMPFDCDSTLPVYQTPVVETPCLFGFWRPAIYLPPDAEALSPDQLRHILIHEETHRRHFDHLWAAARCLCLTLHWYNPLVWLAARMSMRDSELSCDAGAMGRLDGEFADYGRTLIALSCASQGKALLRTATMMTGDKTTLRERIKLIAKRPKPTVLAVILVCILALGAAAVTFTSTVRSELAPELREVAEKARSSSTLFAIHTYADSERHMDNIAPGAVYGADLADLMESGVFRTALKRIDAPSRTPASADSVELRLGDDTRLTIYKRPSRAKLSRAGETLWFRVGGGSYTRAAALLQKPRQDYLDLWPDYHINAARLEKRDGETILITSEISQLSSLRTMTLYPDSSAPDPAEDWVYRVVFDPAEIVKNREELVVLVGERSLSVNGTVCAFVGESLEDKSVILDWFDGKYTYFTDDSSDSERYADFDEATADLPKLIGWLVDTNIQRIDQPLASRLTLAAEGTVSTVEIDAQSLLSTWWYGIMEDMQFSEIPMPPPNPSNYYVTLIAPDAGFSFTFYEDGAGGLVQYSSGQVTRYWQATDLVNHTAPFDSIANWLRMVHDGAVVSPVGLTFPRTADSVNEALDAFAKDVFPAHLLSVIRPGSMYAAERCEYAGWELLGSTQDYLVGLITLAIQPTEEYEKAWDYWTSDTPYDSHLGKGRYAGCYLWTKSVTLEIQNGTDWVCTYFGDWDEPWFPRSSEGMPSVMLAYSGAESVELEYHLTQKNRWDGESWVVTEYDPEFIDPPVLTLDDRSFGLFDGYRVISHTVEITDAEGNLLYTGKYLGQMGTNAAPSPADALNVYTLPAGDYTFTVRFGRSGPYYPDAPEQTTGYPVGAYATDRYVGQFVLRIDG